MAAPHAHIDDVWPTLSDSNTVSEQKLPPLRGGVSAAGGAAPAPPLFPDDDDDDDDIRVLHDNGFTSGETGVLRSTEDLVNDFDGKLSVCSRRVVETDNVGPVSLIDVDSLLEEDEIWNALTSNYGRVMPVEWKRSRTRSLLIPTFKLGEKPTKTDVTAELSDEEELREQLDMHSIIASFLAEEPLFTAEQVIEEIEEIMQDSADMEAEHNPPRSDLSMPSVDVQQATGSTGYEKKVRALDVAELNERLQESETTIGRLSEVLVQQLALRDELDFEKEVKNAFISALIGVENRQREQRELLRKRKKKKKRKKLGGGDGQSHAEKTPGSRFSLDGLSSVIQSSLRQTFGSGCSERQYLTTVIPYEKKGRPPSLQDLQILTRILQAMKDDSDKVPSLLTDYILKVLCPS